MKHDFKMISLTTCFLIDMFVPKKKLHGSQSFTPTRGIKRIHKQ